MANAEQVVKKQREYFRTGATRSIAFRKRKLTALKNAIIEHEAEILAAVKQDLNKGAFEGFSTEILGVLEEIDFMLSHMEKLLKPRRVSTPLMHFPSVSRVYQEPYGCVLIMAPWNYPFLLAMTPLVGAIACGNCAIIKPSNDSLATSAVIRKIVSETFESAHVTVVEGGRAVNQDLLDQTFDLIFFTGSPAVGRVVMEKAAKHLTPVVLELGGKSPCIVDETADIRLAARRIVWGKCLNSGQTCVAPDYLLVHRSVKDRLLGEIQKNAEKFYGEHTENSPLFPKIINRRHYERLSRLIKTGKVVFGGGCSEAENKIGFTLMDDVSWDDPIMKEEIFGPILPVITYENLDDVIPVIAGRAKPLALYLFTRSKKTEKKVIGSISYGGGCVNDTIVHLSTTAMGFGGVGESGMGSYHGADSIRTFSHSKSVLKKSNLIDLPVRYPSFKNGLKVLKRMMKKIPIAKELSESLDSSQELTISDKASSVIAISERLNKKCNYGANMSALTPEERIFYIVDTFQVEVNNGGLAQYWYNSSGAFAGEVASSLSAIGAEYTAKVYREALTKLHHELPADDHLRRSLLDELLTEELSEALVSYDQMIYEYVDDLDGLLYFFFIHNQ